MQYCAAIIILYRPLAGFGKVDKRKIETADKFRNICVLHAIKIAHFLADYRGFHNNATTLSGIALHIIEMACTVLISDIAERIKTTDVTNEYTYLAICVQTLLELEQTYLVAQKVRKILKKIIDICNLDLNRLKQVLAYLDARYQTSPGFSAETNVGPSSRISPANLARSDYRDSTDTRLHGHQNLSTEPHDPPPQNLHVPSPSVPDAPYHEFTEQDISHTYELPLDQTRHFEQ
ncbi:pathway-specific nitrogen regulator NirA, partial [Histoplasma capsulatum]